MTDINVLIQQYWAGNLNHAEKKLLIEILEEKVTDYSDEEYRTFLQLVNEQETLNNKDDKQLRDLLTEIENSLGFTKEPSSVYFMKRKMGWRWVAAAAFLIVSFSTWWLIGNKDKNKPIVSNTTPVWVSFKNETKILKDTLLSDGSIIRTYPQTEISFVDGFKEIKREIKMNGKALFKVARDTSRPFTVYARGFSTNALGTEFEVNTLRKETFSVMLIKGKVLVKSIEHKVNPMDDVYLSPGENLLYDLASKKTIVKNVTSEETITNKNKTQPKITVTTPPELVFSKLPLSVIFQQLESEYAIVIVYDIKTVNDKEYTGSFRKTDGPAAILNTIAKRFGWKVRKENEAYIIE